MTQLERKKMEAELAGVTAAKLQLEYIVAQREDEIIRVKENIKLQQIKEQELHEKLSS